MEVQLPPAMEAKQILSGELCIGFFWRREWSKCTECTVQSDNKDHYCREDPRGWSRSGITVATN
jgi:hypothetical protein